MEQKRWALGAILALALGAPQSHAQTPSPLNFWQFSAGEVLAPYGKAGPTWLVLIGPSIAGQPEYEGSKRYQVEPGAAIDIRYEGRLYLSSGEGIGYDVFRGKNYRVGLGISYDIGRPDHYHGLHGLGDIDPTPQAKFYGDYVFRPRIMGQSVPMIVSLDVRRAIGGYDGTIANVGAYMPIAGSEQERYFVFLGASGTYWDRETAQAYFGVTPAQSARSGLPVFNTSAGPESFGVGISSGWFVTDHWLFTGDVAARRILSNFKESPIVAEPWEMFSSVGIAYLF